MHIVHLTASALFGGPERQMLGLASALSSDYTTSFLSFSEGGRCQPFLAAARASGFDAAELRYDTPRLHSSLCELNAFLRGNFVDALVTHGYKSNLLGRLAARHVGIPIVSVSRGWTGENFKVSCYEAVDRVHLRLMDRVVCVSAGQAERVMRAGVSRHRIRIIRNSARLNAFDYADPAGERKLRGLIKCDGPIIAAAGRLSPEKGFHVLVEAARAVVQQVPDARFVLFGDGPERARLVARIRECELGQHFFLAGFRGDLDALLPWANLVALSSFTEGLPNVVLEACAAGVPVVATAVGGVPEIIEDGENGFLVRHGDANSLAQRIVDLLASPELAQALGANARRRMHEEFSFAAQARAYEAMFDELPAASSHAVATRRKACA